MWYSTTKGSLAGISEGWIMSLCIIAGLISLCCKAVIIHIPR